MDFLRKLLIRRRSSRPSDTDQKSAISDSGPVAQSMAVAATDLEPTSSDSNPVAQSLVAAALASVGVADAVKNLAPGKILVKVFETPWKASSALRMSRLSANAETDEYVILCATALYTPGSPTELYIEDSREWGVNIEEITKPIMLYTSKPTLPYLKKDQNLWSRVEEVQGED